MRAAIYIALAAAGLLLTGCPIPLSQHPLSDDAHSTVDERLLGVWEVDLRAVNQKFANKKGKPKAFYAIERVEDNDNLLRCTELRDGKPADESWPLRATHLAMHDYLSLPDDGEGDKPFVILRYELTDADRGKLYLMDGEFVADQIERGKIRGKVVRDDGKIRSVLLAADTKTLRDFVHRNGADAFDLEHPMPCKRIEPLIVKD